jgi:hypothetical protein
MQSTIIDIEEESFSGLIDKELIGGRKEKRGKASVEEIEAFAKKNGIEAEKVHNYMWKKRKNIGTEKKITKFVESIWRFIFYGIFVVQGYITLFTPQPAVWVTDTAQHWQGWPLYDSPYGDAIKLYYVLELGCYIHQLMWTEVTRSDALEMILHHIVTITVMFLSWLAGFQRIGSSILLVHDVADIFLESAKCFNYTNKIGGRKWAGIVCDALFGVFAVVFFVSRLVIFPKYMLYSLLHDAPTIFKGVWPGYWVYSVLLGILQILHINWFYFICLMIYRLVTTGIEKDERSDDEEDDETPSKSASAKKTK